MEVWKDVVGYEGHYKISDLGRVASIKKGVTKILKDRKHTSPYMTVCFWVDGVPSYHYVHRLVLMSFIGKVEGRDYANHIDGNHKNNALNNLEWVNGYENQTHRFMNKETSSRFIGVCFNKRMGKWVSNISFMGKSHSMGYFDSEKEAALAYINFCKDNGIENKYLVYPE